MAERFYTDVRLERGAILHRGYDENGERFKERVKYKPYLFRSRGGPEGAYKTIHGDTVERVDFDTCRQAEEYYKRYEGTDGIDIYGFHGQKYVYTFIHDEYPKIVPFEPRLIRIGYLDIEVASDDGFPHAEIADKTVTAIGLKFKIGNSNLVLLFGLTPYDNHGRKDVIYVQCDTEEELLNKFLLAWERADLDVVTGWNVEFFDMPYLINRFKVVFGEDDARYKRFSPWGIVTDRMVHQFNNQEAQVYQLAGVTVLDYLRLYKKFPLPERESYKLDHIAYVELGERKLDYSEYGSLNALYKEDPQKFLDYNVKDVELIERLEEKLGLIQQCFAIAYDARALFQDALTSVNLWDVIIHGRLMDDSIVVPNPKKKRKMSQIEGAYVKEPHVGMHDWVVSFDLNSLYPHLIMQYNISPETFAGSIGRRDLDDVLGGLYNQPKFREEMQDSDVTITPLGSRYMRTRQGFLPSLMDHIYTGRVIWKRRMLEAEQKQVDDPSEENAAFIAKCHNMQMALKIQMNSAYGALSNEYFRWYDDVLAETITISGQMSTKWIENELNVYLNEKLGTEDVDYVIAADTDSVYLNLAKYVEELWDGEGDPIDWMDRVCSEIFEPFIEEAYERLSVYVNAFENKMVMKREVIADKGFWIAKKRYALNVWDSEGVRYTEPKVKLKGIEAVRSSTPEVCRDKILGAIRIVLNEDNDALLKFIEEFRDSYDDLPFEVVAFPRGTHDIEKYMAYGSDGRLYEDGFASYVKGTPIHVRASIVYNAMLQRFGLQNRYEEIRAGDKIKFCYMTLPNPARENVMACPEVLPNEFEMHKYLDRDTQFEKTFLSPVINITDAVGWTTERQASIEGFFS